MPGKRVQIDDETWHVLELLRRDKMATFQVEEAFLSSMLPSIQPEYPASEINYLP